MNKIINFHDIANGNWFEDTIVILKSKYNMVGIREIEDFYYNNKPLSNSCHITFDDGDKSFYEVAYPILKKYQIPATIFVSPLMCLERKNFWFQEIRNYNDLELKKIISEEFQLDPEFLSLYTLKSILKTLKVDQIWHVIRIYQNKFNIKPKECMNMNSNQLKEIDQHGLIAIGAHTLRHPILANEDDEKSDFEISESIRGLESILGHEIKYFSYPNGFPEIDFDQREINILKKNGIKLAFSTGTKNFSLNNNPLSIYRFGFSHGNKYFVRLKLFLGEYWEVFKDGVKKGEIRHRIDIEKKLNMKIKNKSFKTIII